MQHSAHLHSILVAVGFAMLPLAVENEIHTVEEFPTEQ